MWQQARALAHVGRPYSPFYISHCPQKLICQTKAFEAAKVGLCAQS